MPAYRQPSNTHLEGQGNYVEHVSGEKSWQDLGLRIRWTEPAVPGRVRATVGCPMYVRICVDTRCSRISPCDICASCWTNIRTDCNQGGHYMEHQLDLSPGETHTDRDGGASYVYGVGLVPVDEDSYRLTFNLKYGHLLIWTGHYQQDCLVKVICRTPRICMATQTCVKATTEDACCSVGQCFVRRRGGHNAYRCTRTSRHEDGATVINNITCIKMAAASLDTTTAAPPAENPKPKPEPEPEPETPKLSRQPSVVASPPKEESPPPKEETPPPSPARSVPPSVPPTPKVATPPKSPSPIPSPSPPPPPPKKKKKPPPPPPTPPPPEKKPTGRFNLAKPPKPKKTKKSPDKKKTKAMSEEDRKALEKLKGKLSQQEASKSKQTKNNNGLETEFENFDEEDADAFIEKAMQPSFQIESNKSSIQQVDRSSIQSENNKLSIQPSDKKSSIQPSDKKSSIQPSDKKSSIQPSDKKSSIQPSDKKSSIQPSDKKSSIQPSDKESSIQPYNSDKKSSIQPSDKKSSIQPSDKKPSIQPSD